MPTDLPVACSLSATELPRRLAEIHDLGRAALVEARTQPGRAELRFAAGASIRERVDAVVAAEALCCAFLTMRVSEEPDAVLLTIDAPAGADVVLAELVAAFRG